MHKSETYLEPSRTSTMELFLGKWLTTLILQPRSIVDVKLGSKYTSFNQNIEHIEELV